MPNFRGVAKHKDGGFVANIGVNGGQVYLGWFSNQQEAFAKRLEAEINFFGAVFDRREIEVAGDIAKVPLHGRGGKFYGWTVIDISDVEKIKDVAWTLGASGYAVGRPPGFAKPTNLHRLILGLNPCDVRNVDHVDGDKLNNRRKNLRICTHLENMKNTRLKKSNTTGLKGVSKTASGRWRARITVNSKEIRLGVFDTKELAAAAYDAAALKFHGNFASTNDSIEAWKRYGSTDQTRVLIKEIV